MNTILLVTTVISSAIALAAVFAVFVAFRQERRRSDARIAMLRQMSEPQATEYETDTAADIPFQEPYGTELAADAPQGMFAATPAESPLRRRLAAAVAVACIVATAGYVLLPGRVHAPDAASAAAPHHPQPAPLELLSLRHSYDAGQLVITGAVQNPRSGAPVSKAVATAFLFGTDGTFLASGRAPLDFSTLAPGDESPFVIAVPVSGTVARYRVGFRAEDGQVISHVDRRTGGTLARTGE